MVLPVVIRMVDVQSETIARYIREEKIKADLVIPMGISKKFNYFREDTIVNYVEEFKWQLITPANMKDKFMEMVDKMDMSYSYKPVLLKAIFENIDDKRRVRVEKLVDSFIDYYGDRKKKGLVVEKRKCLYLRDYTRKEVERNIFSNPFKRFEDMNFMKKNKDLEFIEINRHIMKSLGKDEINWIMEHSDRKLGEYFGE